MNNKIVDEEAGSLTLPFEKRNIMKKLVFLIFLCICLLPVQGLPCTTFVLDNNGQPVYGKNMDWNHVPCFVIVNKRGVAKTSSSSEPDAKHISWTSRFGSVTFNCMCREMPAEGINEAGLFVSEMGLFNDTEFPPPDSRTPMGTWSWVQYQLDNFSTVDEVIASDQNIRISGNNSMGLHYLVSDSKGNCASIELLGGKMVCHTGATMPYKVMVGATGTYDQSITFIKLFQGFGGFFPIFPPVFNRPSLLRFAIAADMDQKYSPQDSGPAIDYAFQILQDVESIPIIRSAVWSAVYDSANKQIHFRSWDNKKTRRIDIGALDFSCTTPVKALDINAEIEGDVTDKFVDYTKEMGLEMLRGFVPTMPHEIMDIIADYPDTTVCTE